MKTGTITEINFRSGFTIIKEESGQEHWFKSWQVQIDAPRVGDRVKLVYRSDPSMGLWYAVEKING